MDDVAVSSRSRSNSRTKRWLVPGAVVVAVALLGFGQRVAADTSPDLPKITTAELLAKIHTAKVDGITGEATTEAHLGLPELGNAYASGPGITSFFTGNQTLRVWANNDGNFKLQLPSSYSETDVVKNGKDMWIWQSQGQKLTHNVAPDESKAGDSHAVAVPKTGDAETDAYANMTPQAAADNFLKSVDPTTQVALRGTTTVAGHDAYVLSVDPKSTTTLVSEIRLAVDAKTYEPLRVQVYAKGQEKVAYSVGFDSVTFGKVDASAFAFTPPKGVKVLDGTESSKAKDGSVATPPSTPSGTPAAPAVPKTEPKIVGQGWNTVAILPSSPIPLTTAPTSGDNKGTEDPMATLLQSSKSVSGAFGTGKLVHTALVNIVLLDDGRIAIGSVDEPTLLAAIPKA